MKNFDVHFCLPWRGFVQVEAKNKEEAKEKVANWRVRDFEHFAYPPEDADVVIEEVVDLEKL